MTTKPTKLFPKTTRNLNDLSELLDGPVTLTLPDKPMTPSQKRRKIRSAFNAMLSHLAILQTELETDARKNTERLAYLDTQDDPLTAGLFGNKLVIRPRPILTARRVLVSDKELKTVQDMFSEVLEIYEGYFKEPWKPQRNSK